MFTLYIVTSQDLQDVLHILMFKDAAAITAARNTGKRVFVAECSIGGFPLINMKVKRFWELSARLPIQDKFHRHPVTA